MTSHGEPRVWQSQFPLGGPRPLVQVHHDLCYPGEVIRADASSPEWGEPLVGDTYFRLVLLQQPLGQQEAVIRDGRIALCEPSGGVFGQDNQLVRDLTGIRDTLEIYRTSPEESAREFLRTLRRQEEELEERFLAQAASWYRAGVIHSGFGRTLYANEVFQGPDPLVWFDNLAARLLADAYPIRPIDGGPPLPRPVGAAEVGQLYGAILGQPGASLQPLAELGPGLGLSTLQRPEVLDLATSAVFARIGGRFSPPSGPSAWSVIHHYWSHQVGLTGPLATLYLLLLLRRERPDLELSLRPDHQLGLMAGQPWASRRLLPDLLHLFSWDPRLSGWIDALVPAAPPGWDEAMPYLSLLSPGLPDLMAGGTDAAREEMLRQKVAILRGKVASCRASLESLTGAPYQEERPVQVSGTLERLSGIAGGNLGEVYQSVRSSYADPWRLAEDLEVLDLLDRLSQRADDVALAREYLMGMSVPDWLTDLAVSLQELTGTLFQGGLLYRARNWGALFQRFRTFRSRYLLAYREHHQNLHRELSGYRSRIAEAERYLSS